MLVKSSFFLVGVLIFIQMILYAQLREKNDQTWSTALKNIEARITDHQNNIITDKQKIKKMERTKSNVPIAILEGVKDPEKKFLQFMDYLDNSELASMQGTYTIASKPTIKYRPVPLQKTDFAIRFEFINAKKLESVLGYLLNQQQEYPLKVNRLEIQRVPKSKPQVYLEVSLLLPAKIQDSQAKQDTGSNEIGG